MKAENYDVNPNELMPNPWNPNEVDPINLEKMKNSIKAEGIAKPILVRETSTGVLEILDGEHRVRVAKELGMKEVPVRVFKKMSDATAKRITLLGNSRYGEDDNQKMMALLSDKSIGSADELLSILPIDESELSSYFTHGEFDGLDDLGDDDIGLSTLDDDSPIDLDSASKRSHKIIRFRIPVEYVEQCDALITRIKHEQGYTESDELTNNGDALCHLIKETSNGADD